MQTKVVAKLKTGSIKNVVPFGSPLPVPPYVVVKEENAGNHMVRFRIIPHMAQGGTIQLRAYVFTELPTLLADFESTDVNGNHFKLEEPWPREWQDVIPASDDSTISMERSFYAPLFLF
jgi:hypothetical protein